jgi:hypothetical protein
MDMYEFEPPTPIDQVVSAGDQTADLREPGPPIGAEGAEPDALAASAHDPATEIDTVEIGCGDDLEIEADTPDLEEPRLPEAAGAVALAAVDTEPAESRVEHTDSDLTAKKPGDETNSPTEFGDTTLPKEAVLSEFQRWKDGEVLESSSTPIAQLEVSEEEMAVLRSIDCSYDIIQAADIEHPDHPLSQQLTGLTEEQLSTLRDVRERFITAVESDAAANGFSSPHDSLTEVGRFRPAADELHWHIDRFRNPTARYVLSLGDIGGTRFAHGPIQTDQASRFGTANHGVVETGTEGSHQETGYPTGTIVRFLANRDIHATPTDEGWRTFFTVSATAWPGRAAEATPADHTAESIETVVETDTALETDNQGEFGDTSLTKAEVLEKFDRWERDEVVESSSTPIAQFEVSKEELAALATVSGDFKPVGFGDLKRKGEQGVQERTGMTEKQLGILQGLGQRFVSAVTEDAARNGLGGPDEQQFDIWIGRYRSATDGLEWHTDRFDVPTVRYVLSLGEAGSTRFAHGPIQKNQLSLFGDIIGGDSTLNIASGGPQEITHPIGTITRFLANHDIHDAPTGDGFRIFFTTSVPIIRDDEF